MCSSFEDRVGWGVQLLVVYKRIWLFLHSRKDSCREAVTSRVSPRQRLAPRCGCDVPLSQTSTCCFPLSCTAGLPSLQDIQITQGRAESHWFCGDFPDLGSGKVVAGVLLCSRFFVSALQQGSGWEYISFLLINRQECQVIKGWSSNKITQTYPVVSCTGYSKTKKIIRCICWNSKQREVSQ